MRDKDHDWIIEHEKELEEKYSGKYVAMKEYTYPRQIIRGK